MKINFAIEYWNKKLTLSKFSRYMYLVIIKIIKKNTLIMPRYYCCTCTKISSFYKIIFIFSCIFFLSRGTDFFGWPSMNFNVLSLTSHTWGDHITSHSLVLSDSRLLHDIIYFKNVLTLITALSLHEFYPCSFVFRFHFMNWRERYGVEPDMKIDKWRRVSIM